MTEREVFAADSEFAICAISNEDRNDYVELHRQLNGETSLYLTRIKEDINFRE